MASGHSGPGRKSDKCLGPSLARDLLQPRQSVYYPYNCMIYLLQVREEKGRQCSSWAGGAITISMCSLRGSGGGGTGW